MNQDTGMLIYKNYPKLPEDLENEILKEVSRRQTSLSKFCVSTNIEKAVTQAYGTLVTENLNLEGLASMSMFSFDPLTDWVSRNIHDKISSVHVQYFDGGTYFFPHIDLLRNKAINYLISTADATTSFYKPNNFIPEPNTVIDYNKITLLKEFKIEKKVWHELDVTVVHSVENINGTRIAVTLSIV